MGQRKDRRVKMVLPIRIAGQDTNGNAFRQLSHTLDFSRGGARLGGVQANLRLGDEITVEYKGNRGRFKVRWVDVQHAQAGVENLDPQKFVFIELPEERYVDAVDASQARNLGETAPTVKAAEAASVPSIQPGVATKSAPENREREAPAAPNLSTAADKLDELRCKLDPLHDDTDAALEIVAVAARDLLRADGAAVAIVEGEDWICRASSGVAPHIGARFQAPQGLTGQAASTGEVVLCRDSEEDGRVNSAVWRAVQLRATAVVPIVRNEDAIGVLELFAAKPNAFDDGHRPLLNELGKILAELIADSMTAGK